MSTLPCKTYRTSFVAIHFILFDTACGLSASNFQQSTTVSVVFTDIHYIFFASDDVNVNRKIANVEELSTRQHIVDEWGRLDQRIIDGAVKEWR